MAIEFNCPYCTSLIRVPDSAGGGKGRCPKCSTRLTVPKVSIQKRAAPSQPVEPKSTRPSAADPGFVPVASRPLVSSAEVEDLGINFTDATEEPEAIVSSDPFDAFAESPAPERRFSTAKLKPRKSGGVWKIVAVTALVVCAIAGVVAWQLSLGDRLNGELIAETAESLDLPPGLVGKSSIGQSSELIAAVLTKLEKTSVPLSSSLMQVQLSGSPKGILIRLSAGPQAQFYKVEVRDNAALKLYHAKHTAALEAIRIRELEQAATSFAAAYHQVITKKSDTSTLPGFRDTLALPALVRGVGHQLIATHGRTAYPCVYEDYEGAWYFLMPPDVKDFQISGRKHANGPALFPGSFKVIVAGEVRNPLKEKETRSDDNRSDKSKGKSKKASPASEEPEEEMDSKSDTGLKPKSE